VSVIIFLSCNDKRCDTILPVNSQDVISARLEARNKGWDTTRHYDEPTSSWVTTDECKMHKRERDWCGHDNLGHRMANNFVRDGFTTVEQVTGADTPTVLDIRNFGRLCLERWEHFKKVDADA